MNRTLLLHRIFRASILTITVPSLHAATWTWQGGTGSWSDPSQWLDETMLNSEPVSASTTDLVFGGVDALQYVSTNDLGFFTLNSLTLNSASTLPQTIGGGTLSFAADGVEGPMVIQNGSGRVVIGSNIETFTLLSFSGTGTGVAELGGVVSGFGGLDFTAGNWKLSNNANTITGGITIRDGAVLELAPAGGGNQNVNITAAAASILGGNAGNVVTINGGRLKLTTSGTGSIVFGAGRPVSFGANGGVLDLRNTNTASTTVHAGHISGGDLSLTLNNTSDKPAVIRFNGGDVGLSQIANPNGGDWSMGGNTLRLSGIAGAGPLRFELENGALSRAGTGVAGTVTVGNAMTVRGVSGGDPTSGPDGLANTGVTRTAGRFAIDGSSIVNYTAGLVFEDAVQVSVTGAARAFDGNITIAGTASGHPGYVAFAGRSTGTNVGSAVNAPGASGVGQNFLYLGQGGNDTLTIEPGGVAVLDARFRTDQPDHHGVLLNATTVIKGGGTLRFWQSVSSFSVVSAPAPNATGNVGNHVVQGSIRGEGSTAAEAVVDLYLPAANALLADETTANRVPHGGVEFQASSGLVINGTGFGGLRVNSFPRPSNLFSGGMPDPVSNLDKVNNYLTVARLSGLTGSGGFLTVAPANTTYTFPNAEWAPAVPVGLKVVDHAAGVDVQFDPLKTSWGHNLAVDAGAELSLGALPFTLSAGTLAGTGSVTGSGGLTVASGAGIAPGFGHGTLTVGDVTLNGSLFIETTNAPASDLLHVNGNLTLGATSVLTLDPASTFNNGTYTIITYTGVLGGTFAAVQNLPVEYSVNYATPGQVRLVFTAIQGKIWNGTPGSAWSTNPGDANWQGPLAFDNGNVVIFDDTAAGTTSVVLNGNVQPALTTFNNSTKNYALNGLSGSITGTGNLELNGTGSVEISGSHSYGGATKINAGTLRLLNDEALPNLSEVNVAAGATLDLNGRTETVGNVTVGGSVTAGNASIGSLKLEGSGSVVANIVLGGNVQKTGTGSASIGGSVDLGGSTRTFTVESGGVPDLAVAGAVSNGGITKTGAGEMTLGAANSYAGGTTVLAGVLRAAVAGAIPDGNLVVNGGTLDLNGFPVTAFSLTGTGGTLALGGGIITLNSAFNGVFAGGITGAGGSIVKLGAGVQTLSGTSSFDGGITINAGRVNVTGATSAGIGPIALNMGSGLQIGATIPNNVTINGGIISSQTGTSLGTGQWNVVSDLSVYTFNRDSLTNSEAIFTGTLRGTGNIQIVQNATQANADQGPGLRLRGTTFSDYSGILIVGNRAKFEIQMADSLAPNPFGTGTIVMTGGTSTGGLGGTYSLFQPRMVAAGQTYPLGNDVIVLGAGYVNFNLLGGADVTALMGSLTIGDGQILSSSKNDDNNRSVEFPTVSLTGGIAEFRAYDPAFAVQTNAARGGGNILLGAISETAPGSGIIFKSGTSAARTYFNEVRGISSYTGPTDIETGILRVSFSGSLASSSQIEVSAGATFDLLQHFSGYLIPSTQVLTGAGSWRGTILLDGVIAPGPGLATLSGDGFTFNGGAEMHFELSTSSNVSDSLFLTGQFGKGSTGTYLFDFEGGGMEGQTYTLVQFGFTDFVASDFSYTGLAPGLTGEFIVNPNDLQFAVIPEPGTVMAVLSGLGVLLAARRRRA